MLNLCLKCFSGVITGGQKCIDHNLFLSSVFWLGSRSVVAGPTFSHFWGALNCTRPQTLSIDTGLIIPGFSVRAYNWSYWLPQKDQKRAKNSVAFTRDFYLASHVSGAYAILANFKNGTMVQWFISFVFVLLYALESLRLSTVKYWYLAR